MMETTRQTRNTLYIVAASYIVVGFIAATVSAVNGDRLGTFLGFLVISGALAVTALFRAVLRVTAQVSAIGDATEDLHRRLDGLETALGNLRERSSPDSPSASRNSEAKWLDLGALGRQDPEMLAAATLDLEAYPRLVKAVEEAAPRSEETQAETRSLEPIAADDEDAKNLMQQWHNAFSTSDLAGCRMLFSTLSDAIGEEAATPLHAQIEELADRVEASLREAYSSRVRGGDYAGALAIGERICGLLPDRAVAGEVQRIRPHLLRKMNREAPEIKPPLAASQ